MNKLSVLVISFLFSFIFSSSAFAKSKGQTINAKLISLTESTLTYQKKGINYTADISRAEFFRSSGGRAQATELKVGDNLKIKLKIKKEKTKEALKITDKSIKRTKLIGFMDEVNDENDTFLLQVKNQNYLVNIEEFTNMIYLPDTRQNGRTKTKSTGLLNTNTKEMYKTEEIRMWSK